MTSINRGIVRFMGALSLAIVVGAWAAPARAVLTLYDNFNNATLSATRWTRDTAGAGSVTFNGTQGLISMSSASTGKHARMVEPGALQFHGENDLFEITWDQQITFDGFYGFANGFCLVTPQRQWYFAGQLGNEGAGSIYTPYYMLETDMTTAGFLGGGPRPLVKYHFDVEMTPVSQWLRVYQYNSSWAATPLNYRAGGVLVDNILGTLPIALDQKLTMLFYAELPLGNDPYAQARDAISVDNVFQGFTSVPEPATAGLVLLTLAALGSALGRRRT
jgi:hypothetical protein